LVSHADLRIFAEIRERTLRLGKQPKTKSSSAAVAPNAKRISAGFVIP